MGFESLPRSSGPALRPQADLPTAILVGVLAAICVIAVIAWVTDQTLSDVLELWRAHREGR